MTCVVVRRALAECRRTQVQLALVGRLAARQKMLREIRSALRRHRSQIHASVQEIRNNCRRLFNAGAARNRSERTRANGFQLHVRSSTGAKRRFSIPVYREESLLRTLRAHPEGIRLVEMGNEVGVDWRHLVQPVHTLADAGRIEQFDELFYPVN